MTDDIFSLLKPGEGAQIALRADLEVRRETCEPQPGWLYRGAGDYLLKHGQFYTGRELPDQYAPQFGGINNCFENAVLAAGTDPSLRYVEGVYAAYGGFTPHAWCIDPDGQVVELTWPTRPEHGTDGAKDDFMGMGLVAPERMAYCGVIFPVEFMVWFGETYGEWCLFDRPAIDKDKRFTKHLDMSQPDHGFPVLKVPYDPARTSL